MRPLQPALSFSRPAPYIPQHSMLVLLLFFCSGATALVYEVLWSRYLTLMLGSTVQAQTVVLAVFMGGLAIGNRLFGRKSERFASPLAAYGLLEGIIGIYAFFYPNLYTLGDRVFVGIGSHVAQTATLLLALKLIISVVLLLLPTVLMGGTLPLIAAWIEKQKGFESGARVGIFYAVNSLGAVVGAAMAGFVLLQSLGMVSSLQVTAFVNVLVALVAIGISKRQELALAPEASAATIPSAAEPPAATPLWLGWMVAFSGGTSMGLEVLSSRAVALIVGGSLQAFALVLMSFILGIGLGSVVISSSRAARKYGLSTIFVLLVSAAAVIILNVLAIEHWTVLYGHAKFGLASNHNGFIWHQAAVAIVAFLILGLPAAFLGAVVPLSIRLLKSEGAGLGDQVGRLLTFNTIGAVVGVLLTGFFFMPVIGLRGALGTLAILLIGGAGWIAFQRHQTSAFIGAAMLAVGGVAGMVLTGRDWQYVLGTGVYRLHSDVTLEQMRSRKDAVDTVFYKDSADATVVVQRTSYANEPPQTILRINGKTDASTYGDLGTQYLLAHVPMMAAPDAKKVFVLGFGSGITAGALLGHPIEQLTIAENCKPVLEAAPLFGQWNRGVFTNARTRIRNDDARAVLRLNPDKYDLIISEPSNPWVAGVASVFTKEFYEICANRLNENGFMAQWFHKYEMNDEIVNMVIRTFASVFPHLEIWDPQEGDLILLGSKKAWESNPAKFQAIFQREQPRKDLAELQINTAVALWTKQAASQTTAAAIPGDGPMQTDEFPVLEYAAPEAFFIGKGALKLYMFDERTIQFTLADRQKIAAMRALPDQALLESFMRFGSSNPDMKLYITALGQKANTGELRIDPMGQIIFRPADTYPETPPVATNATPQFRECLLAEAFILREDARWKEGADRIEKVLREMSAAHQRKLDFSPEYYAALLTRLAIGHRDFEDGLRYLRLGFKFAPTDEQLLFLSRVLDRIAPPDLMTQLEEREKKSEGTQPK